MTTPNRIKIIFDGGTAEIYGDVFSDLLVCWQNQLFDRQKAAEADLAKIKLSDPDRTDSFKRAAFDFDDAESRLQIAYAVESVFKNRDLSKVCEYRQERKP